MRSITRTYALSLGTLMLSLAAVSGAVAQCGGYSKPAALHGSLQSAQPRLLQAAYDRDDVAPIVGLWHVKFISKGSSGIPDGAEVDYGYSTWHSDGTELLNSGHQPPKSSNFCQGVWKQVGRDTYKLNHFAISWDPSGSYLVGPANIKEEVTLSDRSHYKGVFTLDQYDEKGTVLQHIQGIITGVRIEVDTKPSSVE